MKKTSAAIAFIGMVLWLGSRELRAQSFRPSLIAGIGVGSIWDDETFLGRGPAPSAGIGLPLGRHASVEVEASATVHTRSIGALAAEGTAIGGFGRFSYAFRPPTARLRPFASLGYGVVHSTGELTDFAALRRRWAVTEPAVEFGAGVVINSGPRITWRPEVRWSSTVGTRSSPGPAAIGLPIWWPRLGVTLVVTP